MLHVIRWTLRENFSELTTLELGTWRRRPSEELPAVIDHAVARWSPDVMFVHRDAETESVDVRWAEIPRSFESTVRIVPVRMTETWLLIDEQAIRTAADNPNGSTPLGLPSPSRLEACPDPKRMLHGALVNACERSKRRKKRFERDVGLRVQRVAESIPDFSALRQLTAFRAFEQETIDVVGPWLERFGE